MQTKKTAPFGISHNTKQPFHLINSVSKTNYKTSYSTCALARQNRRSILFCLDLFVSFSIKGKRKTNLHLAFKDYKFFEIADCNIKDSYSSYRIVLPANLVNDCSQQINHFLLRYANLFNFFTCSPMIPFFY